MRAVLTRKGLDIKGAAVKAPRQALAAEEVARRLGVTTEWVHTWIQEGALPASDGSVHPWELEKFRVTQPRRILEAQQKPTSRSNWFQRFLDAVGSRNLIEELEMENCRLMLQVQEVQHQLELLSGRHHRLEISAEEMREQLERTLKENLVLRSQRPPGSKKNSRRR